MLSLVACTHNKPAAENPGAYATAQRTPAFSAKNATEAIMTFSHRVELISNRQPSYDEALAQVESQLLHLFGPMENAVFEDRIAYRAAPKEDHNVRLTSIRLKPNTANVYEITYDYAGTIVLEKGPRLYYDILLPLNPSTIYDEAKGRRHENPCVDPYYQDQSDFWYFWSPAPKYPNCKLVEGEHYHVVTAAIDRVRPTAKTTYPEYHRLADANGVIDIHMLFGKDDARNHGRIPDNSIDLNAANYVAIRNELKTLGFSVREWSPGEIQAVVPRLQPQEVPYVEEAVKQFPHKGITMRIRMFYGQTEIWKNNHRPFHFFFRDAIRNAAVLIYDGHSGLGSHLDLEEIRKVRGSQFRFDFPRDKYQIFFFNSCSSYTYYNTLYFQRKRSRAKGIDPKGTKNLDILVNGLSTGYDLEADVVMLRALHLWAQSGHWTSYQTLAKRMDSENLFTVNGDEDNPTSPVW